MWIVNSLVSESLPKVLYPKNHTIAKTNKQKIRSALKNET